MHGHNPDVVTGFPALLPEPGVILLYISQYAGRDEVTKCFQIVYQELLDTRAKNPACYYFSSSSKGEEHEGTKHIALVHCF